jgi:hypothetical protein
LYIRISWLSPPLRKSMRIAPDLALSIITRREDGAQRPTV